METQACLFDIGRYRNTDGPGIRTILFFKGCPLRCVWCSNPYGLRRGVQLSVRAADCCACGACLAACGQAVGGMQEGRLQTDFSRCIACGNCLDACPSACRSLVGENYSVTQLLREVQKDAAFYRRGGGGVTISGGEALLQGEAVIELLTRCRAHYLNTCLETCAYASWETLQAAAALCNTIFVDLKHSDSAEHKRLTGVGNDLIVENIEKLCHFAKDRPLRVIVRIPLIPGYTTGRENMEGSARFIASLAGKIEVNFLPYHSLGEGKYESIGEDYALAGREALERDDLLVEEACAIFRALAPENPRSVGGDAIALH